MTDDQIRQILVAIVVPAAVGAAAGIIARLASAKGLARLALAAAPALLGAGYLAAHWMVHAAPPRWPPIDSESRLFLLASGVTILGAVAGAARIRAAGWAVLAISALAAPIAVLWPAIRRAADGGAPITAEQLAWGAGGAAACGLIALPVLKTDREGYPRAAAIVLAGVGAASGAALAASHSMKLAQFALAAGAATAAHGLIAPRWESLDASRLGVTTVAVPAAILAALLTTGGAYGELRPEVAAALALAPLAGLLAAHAPLRWPPKQTWGRVAAAALVALAAVIAAAALAESGGYDYEY